MTERGVDIPGATEASSTQEFARLRPLDDGQPNPNLKKDVCLF